MNKQLIGFLLSIILPLSIASAKPRPKQPQTIANATTQQVNTAKNDQSSFVQRMQKREEARQQTIAALQSGAKTDRVAARNAPEVQTPKSGKIDENARANRHVN